MTTEADLLAGMVAHPGEIDRWLVLADWLEDQGDPRAELARLRWHYHAEPEHPDAPRRQARQQALLAGGLAPLVPTLTNSLGMVFALVQPGSFWMGSPDDDPFRHEGEVCHRATLAQPFFLGVYPFLVGEFAHFVESKARRPSRSRRHRDRWRSPGFAQTDRHPVVCVTWNDAQAVVAWLNKVEAGMGRTYALPTEAQWEYASRAGTDTYFTWGNDPGPADEYAWFDENAGRRTHPVDTKRPNGWGLWHMGGLVWEWCQDWDHAYPDGPVVDPVGTTPGSRRVLRGGSWDDLRRCCRPSNRGSLMPGHTDADTGFRVAFTVAESG